MRRITDYLWDVGAAVFHLLTVLVSPITGRVWVPNYDEETNQQ